MNIAIRTLGTIVVGGKTGTTAAERSLWYTAAATRPNFHFPGVHESTGIIITRSSLDVDFSGGIIARQ